MTRPDPRDFGRGGPVIFVLALLGTPALLVAAALVVLRLAGPGGPALVVGLTSAAPHAILAAVVAVSCWLAIALLRRGRRAWLLTCLSVVTLATLTAWQIPLFVGSEPDEEANLVVMAVNCRIGMCDTNEVSHLVRRYGVDVLVLSELTPAAAARFERSEAAGLLSHSFGEPASGISGTVTYSRAPLGDGEVMPMDSGMHVVAVKGQHPFTMVAVHTGQPLQGAARWRGHLEQVHDIITRLDGPVVSAGDFNATLDHAQLRTAMGPLRDAAEQANAGWQPTWQPQSGALPVYSPAVPLLAIDHVLVGGGVQAVRTETGTIEGTDHRALIAWLAFS